MKEEKNMEAQETLNLCNELNLPMVLDFHHHNCNNNNENIYELTGIIIHSGSVHGGHYYTHRKIIHFLF